jgi:hypothetical protein
MSSIAPLPDLPVFPNLSPWLVRILDGISDELCQLNDEEFAEFYCFARDYSRIYRYHLDHAQYQLVKIYQLYQEKHKILLEELKSGRTSHSGWSVCDQKSYEIYWNFETYLSTINITLDTMSRIVGTAYPDQVPISFNSLCTKKTLSGIVELLRYARSKWVTRLKDYRDCFTHYTPVSEHPIVTFWHSAKGWEIRCRLPTNPNVRDIMGFRYSRRVELLKYAIATYRNMMTLDKRVAGEIRRLYQAGSYPMRTKNLFFLGARERSVAYGEVVKKGKAP